MSFFCPFPSSLHDTAESPHCANLAPWDFGQVQRKRHAQVRTQVSCPIHSLGALAPPSFHSLSLYCSPHLLRSQFQNHTLRNMPQTIASEIGCTPVCTSDWDRFIKIQVPRPCPIQWITETLERGTLGMFYAPSRWFWLAEMLPHAAPGVPFTGNRGRCIDFKDPQGRALLS